LSQAFEYRLGFFLDVGHYMSDAYSESHPNRRIHGHTFHGEWIVVGAPNEHGFVIEAEDAQSLLQSVLDKYDHRLLNDISGLENPTTEMLALKIYQDLVALEPRTVAIELYRPSVRLRVRYPATRGL
jgi:6-pyruvoyltetrahydropterin/6-carboxytetrahydropterin synthase